MEMKDKTYGFPYDARFLVVQNSNPQYSIVFVELRISREIFFRKGPDHLFLFSLSFKVVAGY